MQSLVRTKEMPFVGIILTAAVWVMALPAAAQSPQSMPAVAQSSAENSGIEEIVVTAQRRTESVQKSSLAIQVLDPDELARAGVNQARDLNTLVPGLQIAFGGNETQTFIRGIGDFSSTGFGQSAVAFNTNGVYIADQASVGPLFYDIARVEVLKGPQGTLYGRNATAGAVNLIANAPTQELGGYVTAEGGNYGLQSYNGAFNLPVTDTLSTRTAFQYISRNGYLSDRTDDDLQKSGRFQALWKPMEGFSVLLIADLEELEGYGPGAVVLPRQPGTGPFTGAVNAINNAALLAAATAPPFIVATPGSSPNPTPGNTTGLLEDSNRNDTQRNFSAEFNYDLGFANLTFIPALRTSNDTYFGYEPGSPFSDLETVREESYELRLAKTSDLIKWVGGLYFFDDHQSIDQFSVISPFVGGLHVRIEDALSTKSYAAFGQATVSVSDPFRLIGGLRYTHEVKDLAGNRTQMPLGPPVVAIIDSNADFNAVNFKAGFELDLTDVNMVYGTVSTGFKSGGFNTFQPANGISNVYQPEKLTDYELGIRNRFFDNRFQFNVEGFYWKDKDSQQSHLGYDPTGNLQFLTLNAASANIYGVDFDIVAKPLAQDTIKIVLEYLHTDFDNFVYAIPTVNYSSVGVACAASPSTVTAGMTEIDCSGKPLPRAPQWSGTAAYQHDFDVPTGVLTADVDLNFAAKRYLAVDYVALEDAPAYVRENASLTYTAAGKKWSITAFGRNLSNRVVYTGGIEQPLAPTIFYSNVDAPRTYGGRVTVNF